MLDHRRSLRGKPG